MPVFIILFIATFIHAHPAIVRALCKYIFAAVVQESQWRAGPGFETEATLKVHKNENFFGFDFEICTFS